MSFILSFLIFYSTSMSLFSSVSLASDTLRENQVLQHGQTLVSSNNRFELGFFTAGNSNNTYLGLWYKNIREPVVWVANRNRPIRGSSGRLSLTSNGFTISYENSSLHVLSFSSGKAIKNPVLRLLNNGNLVFRDETTEGYDWQSFDYVTDNLLPDMKLGWNLKTGLSTNMTCWSSDNDPSEGKFTYRIDSPETPQLVLTHGTETKYRLGPWDGVRFSGSLSLRPNPVFMPLYSSTSEELYYTFRDQDKSTMSRFVVTQQGLIQYMVWSESSKEWTAMSRIEIDGCNSYGVCGPYGICYGESYPFCECLRGFRPKWVGEWDKLVWSSGCQRKWNLSCESGGGDGFVKLKALKLPDKSYLAGNRRMTSAKECEDECLKNCLCTAYAWLDIHNNGGDCVMWSGDLVDMMLSPDGGEDLYIRMARQELKAIADAKKRRQLKVALLVGILAIIVTILVGVIGCYVFRQKKMKIERKKGTREEEDLELPHFDLHVVSAATRNFSLANKIGEGGFGPVYKGVLPCGQEIAVKRLSENSGQGIIEFKNEVILIKKLQHRNLVRLLGCCIQGEERILVYEYLPNSSLNFLLFDVTRQQLLTWTKRFDIIMGIARGLLYLHQDSRLRIIHRDLKASNILLDIDMNPKISDFGIARIFGGDHTHEKTKRVIGTYGYMSPEYAISGHFSVKSDVYSFGVLVLEIISGKKNWGFYHPDHHLNLLGHVWKLWNEGNPLEVVDAKMEGQFSAEEVTRCIEVGLLCVQQRSEDRPTMSTVLLMLSNEKSMDSELFLQPKQPGFFTEGSIDGDTNLAISITNDLSVTILEGR